MSPEDLYYSTSESGFVDADRFFEYAGYKARDMREPLRRVKDLINDFMDENFIFEGIRTLKGHWEPLTKPYELRKHAEGFELPILQRTQHMMDALLFNDDLWTLTRDELTFDPHRAPAPYEDRPGRDSAQVADYHQGGTSKMDARPILELTEREENAIRDVFREWLDELKAANRRRAGLPGVAPL